MRDTTLSLNSEPKYYPVEVLLKNQSQELPEDVNPAKKEVSGCMWCTWSSPWVKHLLSIQPRTELEHCKALNRHLSHPGAQAENPGLLLASFFSPPTSIHQLASIHCSPSLCCQYGPAIMDHCHRPPTGFHPCPTICSPHNNQWASTTDDTFLFKTPWMASHYT